MTEPDHFENELRRRLNASVDDRLRDVPRTPPPFRADQPPGTASKAHARRLRARWLPPLLAAACIALAVLASAVGAKLINADPDPAVPDPVGPTLLQRSPGATATPSVTAPRPTASPTHVTRSRTTSNPPSRTSSPPAKARPSRATQAPTTRRVTVGDVSVTLPKGWESRDYKRYLPSGGGTFGPAWCLTPSRLKAKVNGDCPILLTAPETGRDKQQLDPDVQGGYASNPSYCYMSELTRDDVQAEQRDFGGRDAEYRAWQLGCADGRSYSVEQYEVVTVQPYILYAEKVTPSVHDAMATIVAGARLPDATRPLRTRDRGKITALRRSGDTVKVTLQRLVDGSNGGDRREGSTVTYTMRAKTLDAFADGDPHKVGDKIQVFTDGRTVFQVY